MIWILKLPVWLTVGLCIIVGSVGGLSIMYALGVMEPRPRYTPAGEWVRDDIQLGNAVVHRGRVACPLDVCPRGQYGYWRLWDLDDYPVGVRPAHEKGRFGCGCAKEGEAPPPEVFVIEARTFDPPSPECGRSATCVGVERLYCAGPYRPWCAPNLVWDGDDYDTSAIWRTP